MAVFVLDKRGTPLMPCSEKRARVLLARGRARVHRLVPFTIRIVDRLLADSAWQPLCVKIDPGSKTTGIALVRETAQTTTVLGLFALSHRGRQISAALRQRANSRRRRRSTNLRYRAPRFRNRTKPAGWLPPSLRHRVETTMTWVHRLQRLAPIAALSVELVHFDMQLLEHPDIAGVAYQHGTLAGYELREYLLEKWKRQCAYCDKQDVPLQIDHIVPTSASGSNRVSNLTLACRPCNQNKGSRDIRDFVKDATRLQRILAHAKAPLRDAAAVNTTRWALCHVLQATGLPVETGTGGRTKWNRARCGIPKTHALDAVCVGVVEAVRDWHRPTLTIKATGRGSYQRTRLTPYGFPRGYLPRKKQVHGFQTGDLVKAVVPSGKKVGIYLGRVAVRASGSFNIQCADGVAQGISCKHCRVLQRNDGYGYAQCPKIAATQ